MPRFLPFLLALLLLWIATGIFVVRGNERAVVRRFGKALSGSEGTILLKGNGVHFDWPWPLAQVDRVSLTEVRSISVPGVSAVSDAPRLLDDEDAFDPAYLTGDKNLLDVRLTVQYRIAEEGVREFLFGSISVEDRLTLITQSAAADLLSRGGVDFVQLSGLSDLRRVLVKAVQQRVDRQRLGVIIEEVILDEVSPPVQVKADFLDVANARADREQLLQAALSQAEQRKQSAMAEARQIRDAGLSQAQQTLFEAKGLAARFIELMAAYQNPNSPNSAANPLARRLILEQQYFQAVSEILGKIQGKVFLDTGQPVDLTIWRSLPKDASKPKSDR
jgi:membrane protease subunit HflK